MKPQNILLLTAMVGLALSVVYSANQSKDDRSEVALQAAIKKETIDGDLKGAIEQYKKIAQSSSRAVAAKALVRMGQCYEKLGSAEARKAYERVLREYASEAEPVAEARARLAALNQPASVAAGSEMVVRRVWAGSLQALGSGGVSPDGRYFSYRDLATRGLTVRDLATGEMHRIDGPQPGTFGYYVRFSPDSRQVVYVWDHRREGFHDLRILPLDARPAGAAKGSEARVLYSPQGKEVKFIQSHDWSADGKYILATFQRSDRTNQIVLVSVVDGSVRVLKSLDWRYPLNMSFSPDGRYIAYDFPPKEDSPARDIFVLATDGSREIPLVEHPADDRLLGWAPDGERVLFRSDRTGRIDAWLIQVAAGKPQASPALVKRDFGLVSPLGFSRKGSFYYGFMAQGAEVYTAELDPQTGKVVVPETRATERMGVPSGSARWSPDGQYLAYFSGPSSLNAGLPNIIVIRSLKTGEERELSPKLHFMNGLFEWSPDGKYLLVTGLDQKGRHGFFQVDAKTSDKTIIASGSHESELAGCWSPDGKAFFYSDNNSDRTPPGSRIVRRDLQTAREEEIYRTVSPPARSLRISPDGRWLAFSLDEHSFGGPGTMIIPAAGGEARKLPAPPPRAGHVHGEVADWTPDGRHVLFLRFPAGYEWPSELWRIPVDGGEPQKLDLAVQGMSSTLSLHPDGRRIAFTVQSRKGEVWVMENFLPKLRAAR